MKLEDILSQFLSLTDDAIAIARRSEGENISRYEWVNDPFCRMFGMNMEDAIGSRSVDIHHPDYFDDFSQSVAESLEMGEHRMVCDTLCVRKSGETFWASVSMFMVPDPTRETVCFGIVLRDISELKDREQAAELALGC